MTMAYAEVVGDPVAHSKSPLIHRYWLQQLALAGDYRARLVPRGTLRSYLAERRPDRDWSGCSVTIPHKEAAAALVDELDAKARSAGAINCIYRRPDGLAGTNTDIDGVAAALEGVALEGSKAVIIGGGGAARAAIAYLARRKVEEIVLLVRSPDKAASLSLIAPGAQLAIADLGEAARLLDGSAAVINASPLGMTGCPEMPPELLAAVARHASGRALFDMVYDPVLTPFLAVGRDVGAQAIDGLTMLLGQAAGAFELFFGTPAPAADERLRRLLVAAMK